MLGGVVFDLQPMFAPSTHSCHTNCTKSAAHNSGDVTKNISTYEAKGNAAVAQMRQSALTPQVRATVSGNPLAPQGG